MKYLAYAAVGFLLLKILSRKTDGHSVFSSEKYYGEKKDSEKNNPDDKQLGNSDKPYHKTKTHKNQ